MPIPRLTLSEWDQALYHVEFDFVVFCSFFPCSLTVFHNGRKQKSGVRQALEVANSTGFHMGRQ